MFKKPPICEVCEKQPATSFSHFEPNNSVGAQPGWLFTCNCTEEAEDYYIRFENFFASPASTVDWLAHMHEKTWMDWPNFMTTMGRFRRATDSYGQV